jgi:hypothetical protein
MSIRALQVELTAHHNQHLWFCSNGQPVEMSQLTSRRASGARIIAEQSLSSTTNILQLRQVGLRAQPLATNSSSKTRIE